MIWNKRDHFHSQFLLNIQCQIKFWLGINFPGISNLMIRSDYFVLSIIIKDVLLGKIRSSHSFNVIKEERRLHGTLWNPVEDGFILRNDTLVTEELCTNKNVINCWLCDICFSTYFFFFNITRKLCHIETSGNIKNPVKFMISGSKGK